MNRPAFVDCLIEAHELLNADERAVVMARLKVLPLDLIRQARQAHSDAGGSEFHQGGVAVCEELERVGGGGETNRCRL